MALMFAICSSVIPIKPIAIEGAKLAPIDPQEPKITGSGFGLNAVFENVNPHITGIELYGSAIAGDASTGTVRTRWYRPFPHFYLLLSGYPVNFGCEIYLELFTASAGITKVPIYFDENPQHWRLQRISLAGFPHASKFRIVALDNSTKVQGWLGFSPPFTIPRQKTSDQLATQLLLIVFCSTACLVATLGPGIILRAFVTRPVSPVWIPCPGIFMVAAIGLLIWIGPRNWPAPAVSRVALALLFCFVLATLIRRPLTSLLSATELKVLGVIVLLLAIGVAKSTYSMGPSGELYRGTISHSLEGGGRSDTRISYHVVHLAAERLSPYGELESIYFGPWTFSHRGPIAGLFATPLVLCPRLAGFANPAVDISWTPFDSQGFTSYRIAMMALAAGGLFVVYGLAQLWLDDKWALLAFLVVAGAPFTIHEIFFTWPKLLAGSFVLLAAYLLVKRRFFASGLAVGIGYLCHPSVLFCFPSLLAMVAVALKTPAIASRRRLVARSRCAFKCLTGLVLVLLFWRLVNGDHFHQDSFFTYFHQASPFPFTPINWLHSRLINFSMTLVPMDAFAYHESNPEMMAFGGLSNPWAQFVQQYWATLPFGVGVVFYPALILLMVAAFVKAKAKAWAWFVILPPFAMFLIYWGAGNSGLLREGLHGWVLGLLIFAVVIWRSYFARSRLFWRFATLALLRGVETVAMLVPFSAWSRGYVLQKPFAFGDLCMLTTMILGSATLAFLSWLQCCRCIASDALSRDRTHAQS